jgi:hypothetical protein
MTGADRAAYLNAFSAAKKRVEAEGRRICHVIWRDGHLSYESAEIFESGDASPMIEPESQGTLL